MKEALGNLHGFTYTESVKLLFKNQTPPECIKGIVLLPTNFFSLNIYLKIQYILTIRSYKLKIKALIGLPTLL